LPDPLSSNINPHTPPKKSYAGSIVISIILVVAITVVLLAVTYTWTGCIKRSDEQTPTVGAIYQPYDNNFSVHVEKVDPAPTNHTKLNYVLLDEANQAVPGVQGNLRDIYNLNFSHETTNVSYLDQDKDSMLSPGDVFLIKHKDYGGQALEGYSLLLRFEPTGDKINGGGTRLG